MLKDPVCGKGMNRNKAHIAVEFEHVRYFLCCPHCQATFESSPREYARPEYGEKVRQARNRAAHRAHT
jgi:YHS domain-containing protein